MSEDLPDNGAEDVPAEEVATEDVDVRDAGSTDGGLAPDRPETLGQDPVPDDAGSRAPTTRARRTAAQKNATPSRAPRTSTSRATKKTAKSNSSGAKPAPQRTTVSSRDGASALGASGASSAELDITADESVGTDDSVDTEHTEDTDTSGKRRTHATAARRTVSATPEPVSAGPGVEDEVEDGTPAVAETGTPAEAGTSAGSLPVRVWRAGTTPLTFARGWVVIVGLVVAGLVAGLIVTNVGGNGLDDARTSALAASQKYAVELGGYDYRHLNRDFGAVLADSTPVFRRSFRQSSAGLRSTLIQYHATSKATAVAVGLKSISTDRAVVLVFLDQTIANSQQAAPTVDRSRVVLTLVRPDGRWLINDVKLG